MTQRLGSISNVRDRIFELVRNVLATKPMPPDTETLIISSRSMFFAVNALKCVSI